MNGTLGKTAATFSGSGFAALVLFVILWAKENFGFELSPEVAGFGSIGLTWLGNRLFGVVTKSKND